MVQMQEGEAILTVPEAARHMRVSEATVKRLIADARLPIVRIDSAVRILREDVDAFMRGARVIRDVVATRDARAADPTAAPQWRPVQDKSVRIATARALGKRAYQRHNAGLFPRGLTG